MNCYDCAQLGRTTTAIAICNECGAAICSDHATERKHTLTVFRATNARYPVEPSQRRVRCLICSAAVDKADELSIARASRR